MVMISNTAFNDDFTQNSNDFEGLDDESIIFGVKSIFVVMILYKIVMIFKIIDKKSYYFGDEISYFGGENLCECCEDFEGLHDDLLVQRIHDSYCCCI